MLKLKEDLTLMLSVKDICPRITELRTNLEEDSAGILHRMGECAQGQPLIKLTAQELLAREADACTKCLHSAYFFRDSSGSMASRIKATNLLLDQIQVPEQLEAERVTEFYSKVAQAIKDGDAFSLGPLRPLGDKLAEEARLQLKVLQNKIGSQVMPELLLPLMRALTTVELKAPRQVLLSGLLDGVRDAFSKACEEAAWSLSNQEEWALVHLPYSHGTRHGLSMGIPLEYRVLVESTLVENAVHLVPKALVAYVINVNNSAGTYAPTDFVEVGALFERSHVETTAALYSPEKPDGAYSTLSSAWKAAQAL